MKSETWKDFVALGCIVTCPAGPFFSQQVCKESESCELKYAFCADNGLSLPELSESKDEILAIAFFFFWSWSRMSSTWLSRQRTLALHTLCPFPLTPSRLYP